MKKLSMLFMLGVMILVFTVAKASSADLTVIGTANYLESSYNIIYEDNGPFGPITWLDHTRDFDTWQNQIDWASGLGANLTVTLNPGYTTTIDWTTGWRLPETVDAPLPYGTTGGYNVTTSEMGHLNYISLVNGPSRDYSPFNNLHTDDYWSGTEYSTNASDAWGFFFGFGSGLQLVMRKDSVGTALAVHPGDVGFAADKVVTDIDPPGFNSAYWTGDDVNNTDQLKNANPETEEAWLEALLGKAYDDLSINYIDRILKGTDGLGLDDKGLINFDPAFAWDYAVVKYDGMWIAYEGTGNDNLLTTDTFNWGISHLTFFGPTSVPEPATLLLLGLGLVGLAGMRRKFKR